MATILQSTDHGILHIRLNRPDKRNALNDEMFDELAAITERLGDAENLSAVVLSGEGLSFCAGLDFAVHRSFAAAGATGERLYADPDDPGSRGRTPGRGQRIVRNLRDAPVPVIAALHGHAIGGGLQIALGADIRIATPDVKLGLAEISWGLTVDMGASQLLPRLVGTDRALELLVTGRNVAGTEGYATGLVTRLSDDPVADAVELAQVISEQSHHAIVETKKLVRLSESASIADGMHAELIAMAANIGSPAQAAAAERYFAKRASRV